MSIKSPLATYKRKPMKVKEEKSGAAKKSDIEINGVTLKDFEAAIGKLMLMLGPEVVAALRMVWQVAAAAVKDGKGAALAIAMAGFMPTIMEIVHLVGGLTTSIRNKQNAETIKLLLSATSLSADDERLRREKILARVDDFIDYAFPPSISLVLGNSAELQPGQPSETKVEEAGVAPPKERKRRVKKADGVDRVGDPRQLPTANNAPELE